MNSTGVIVKDGGQATTGQDEQPASPPIAADPVAAPPAVDESPLAEHEAVFGPPDPTLKDEAKKENDEKRQKARHRAASQEASPADVPRIQKFTKDIRERDEKLSTYERRIQELEARVSQPAAVPTTRNENTHSAQQTTQPSAPAPTRPKPSMDDIADDGKYATFEAYQDDLLEWRDEQREAARRVRDEQQQRESQQQSARDEWLKNETNFGTKLAEFKKTHPDYDTLAASEVGQMRLPPAAYKAVHGHDNGPALVYYLFTHPDALAEVQLLLDGRPPTADYVAIATRWLTSRALNGSTGSFAPKAPSKLAPPPPNPVRTGHTTTGDLPDDDAPLSEHERKWGPRRR